MIYANKVLVYVVAFALASPLITHAGIIVDQPPFVGAGGPGSDTALIDDFGNPGWEISADEFISPANATVNRIVWWGFYGGNSHYSSYFPPTGDETMRIRFYAPRAGDGLPGAVSYEATILNATRVPTGASYGPHPAYRFESDLTIPFTLEQSGHYWFEVTQIGDADSAFRRFLFPDYDTPLAFLNNWVSDWNRISLGGLAFQMIEVPEPPTLCFLSASLITLLWKGVRMTNRPLAGSA